jgi:hypothetical protein
VKTETEWAIRSNVGIFSCRDEHHAKGMMQTTSPVLGDPETRVIVTRQVTEWKPVSS